MSATPAAEDLARLVILTLDKRQEFFKFKQPSLLREAQAMERRLRRAARDVLHPPQDQPPLFEG